MDEVTWFLSKKLKIYAAGEDKYSKKEWITWRYYYNYDDTPVPSDFVNSQMEALKKCLPPWIENFRIEISR